MARYDQIYATLAKRAVKQGGVDAQTFMERAQAAGMSPAALEERLIADVDEGGPIFGKFLRSLEGAGAGSVLAAERQGEAAARAYFDELISLEELDNILEDGDAEKLSEVETQLDEKQLYQWVAMLVRTCDRCLALHGKIATMSEFVNEGLTPEMMHDGWDSECHCDMLPIDEIHDLNDTTIPLIRERVKSETGLLGSKRTQRLVAQRDLDKAMAAVEKAKESLEGRRTLRLMGEVQAGGDVTVTEEGKNGRAAHPVAR
jgi:hypothetical protein